MANFNNQFATQKLRQETSVTGTGAGMTPSTVNNPTNQDWYTTKNKKKVKKEVKDVEPKLAAGKAKVYMKDKWGWKEAPSISNRPSKGGFMYSQIFEELSNFLKTNSQELARIEGLLAKARETKDYSVMTAYENRIKLLQLLVYIEKKLGKQLPVISFGENFDEYLKTKLGYEGPIKVNKTGTVINLKDIADSIINSKTINEAIDRVHIGTDRPGGHKEIYYDRPPGPGTFWVNIIDKAGNKWNKLQVNTIYDVIAKFPSFSWTEKGIELFPEFEPEEQGDDEDSYDWFTNKHDDEPVSDYSKYRQDPEYYEKNYQEKGTSDYFQRRALDEDDVNDYWTDPTRIVKIKKGNHTGKTGEIVGAGKNKEGKLEFDVAVGPQKTIITYDKDDVDIIKELNESYSKFKNETKTRGKADQFHQAIREVRKKVQEINRLFEYVSRLKLELSEGEGGLKYKVHTEKALAKIKEMVAELNQNIKKFK